MLYKFILTFCFLISACAPTPAPVSMTVTTVTDAELEAAIRQARDTLDTFTGRIATPHADRTFVAVKVRFYPPDELPQDIWVDGVTYTDGMFQGNMGDDIPSLKLEAGEKIRVDKTEIVDWMIVEEGKLIGGYTSRLAVQRMSPE